MLTFTGGTIGISILSSLVESIHFNGVFFMRLGATLSFKVKVPSKKEIHA